jgi:hypothetical protein
VLSALIPVSVNCFADLCIGGISNTGKTKIFEVVLNSYHIRIAGDERHLKVNGGKWASR